MIELTRIKIKNYDDIIVMRNKLYKLAFDLKLITNTVTRLAAFVSETSYQLLRDLGETAVHFSFSKESGDYYFHVFVLCPKEMYSRFERNEAFRGVDLCLLEEGQSALDLKLKIVDGNFKPSDEFLREERERLIQQSNSEMVHEINRKNIELMKALENLKNSSHLIQTEKMRALGTMTAGVAHELNNPMMGILNFIQYAIKHTEKEDRRYQPLMDAEREVNRCQEIITNLLTFSRMKAEGKEELSKVKTSVLFDRVLSLQTYKLRQLNVTIIKNFPTEEPVLEMKENGIQQVILNLINNAMDAMKSSQKKELRLAIIPHENELELQVSDTGSGMDEETMDNLYEPFFTTKPAGQGTGLGLSVSKSIIDEHQGRLSCQSKVGEGTLFSITLPIDRKANEDKQRGV